jgi:tetratricopeptide (TPR) repeat protein
MSLLHGRILASLLLAGVAGCATKTGSRPVAPVTTATTRPVDAKALLALDQIEPRIAALPAPTTRPTDRAPLRAIELYAKARTAMHENRRFGAINLLKEAVAVDPYSAELRMALAKAQLGTASFNDESIASLEKAASLEPDNVDSQLELGRQYSAKNDLPKAIAALRRATLTKDYREGDDRAALVDLYLADSLQLSGYDQASLNVFRALLGRLQNAGPELRGNPEVNYLVTHPEVICLKVGALHERIGQYAQALTAYEDAARRDPDNFDLQVRIVRMLNELHRPDARDRATKVVRAFDARGEAVTLLRETHRAAGNEAGAIDVLRQLHKEDPEDRLVFYALADVLQQMGYRYEARQLLASRLQQNKYDVDLLDRLLRLHEADDDWQGGARLLIEASTARPELVSRMTTQWSRLVRPTARRRIRLQDVQALTVPKEQEGAKQFWVATLASHTSRAPLAKGATELALSARPAYAPAYRMALVDALNDEGEARDAAVKALLDRAADSPALSAELQGLVQIAHKQPAQAETTFRRAMELGNKSPELQDALADALLAQNKDAAAEKALWQIAGEWPDYELAYLQLVGFYNARQREDQLVKTLESWLAGDTSSYNARILQAQYLVGARRPDAADNVLGLLLSDKSDNPEVLSQVASIYAQQGRLDYLVTRLSDLFARNPKNRDVLERLVEAQVELKRQSESAFLVDNARRMFVGDADGLYFVSGLYQRLEQKDIAEQVLEQALQADPKHPAANNDLGYNWADTGRNLEQAEKLVRTAVRGEPDNQAFLDSLGWVLYKRSNFSEAATFLQQASEGPRPDPVVLDHLADTQYRLGDREKAKATWEFASRRLEQTGTQREDLRKLKLELANKLKQMKDGSPVTVAPVVEAAKADAESRSNRYGSTQERSSGEKRSGRP